MQLLNCEKSSRSTFELSSLPEADPLGRGVRPHYGKSFERLRKCVFRSA